MAIRMHIFTTRLAITISIEYMATIYSYNMVSSLAILRAYTETIHILFMWYTAFMYSSAWYFVYCYTWSCVACWVLLLERAFSSVQLNIQDGWELYMHYNLCIIDTLKYCKRPLQCEHLLILLHFQVLHVLYIT